MAKEEIHKFEGLRELEQNLFKLGQDMHERGVKRMMSKAAEPMRDDARARAPVLAEPHVNRIPGVLRDAITIWRHRKTPWAVTYYVGVRLLSRARRRKFKSFKDRDGNPLQDNPKDPFYWRFVEFGTSNMKPRPFLRPAFEAKKVEAVRVAMEVGRKFVETTARRFKRRRR